MSGKSIGEGVRKVVMETLSRRLVVTTSIFHNRKYCSSLMQFVIAYYRMKAESQKQNKESKFVVEYEDRDEVVDQLDEIDLCVDKG